MTRPIYATTDFGPRLRRLRQERGWTLAQLAEKINGTVRSVFYYEQEGRYPPAPVLAKLAQTLGVTMECLMGLADDRHPASDMPDLDTPEDRRLWKKFRQLRNLSERDQAAIFRIINNTIDAPKNTSRVAV